jgi:hypothetical protein
MNPEGAESNASIVRQNFGGDELVVQGETASTAIAAAAKASIEARYILALKRPRDWDVVRQKLLKECARPGFAEAAIYKKPVGSKKNDETGEWEKTFVEGLSVRFAEAAIRNVSNFYSSATSIYDDGDKSIVRITVMDLESNATIEQDVSVSKTVERKSLKKGQRPLGERINSYGDPVFIVSATDDEVLNKTNALISKALRNGVLRLLPGDIQDDCEEACRATAAKRDKEDPEGAKKRLFDGFATLGIMPDALKEYLGHSNALRPAELADLRLIYSAIRDGETTWAAIVDAKAPQADGDKKKETAAKKAVDDVLQKQREKQAAQKAEKAKADAAKTDASKAAADKEGDAAGDAQKSQDPAADSSGNAAPGANDT